MILMFPTTQFTSKFNAIIKNKMGTRLCIIAMKYWSKKINKLMQEKGISAKMEFSFRCS